MQVRTSSAPAHTSFHHHAYAFCSDRCRERFQAEPARFVEAPDQA
jgi:YHS domain-containing protein